MTTTRRLTGRAAVWPPLAAAATMFVTLEAESDWLAAEATGFSYCTETVPQADIQRTHAQPSD